MKLPIDMSWSEPASSERLERAAKALRQNGLQVHVVETPADALRLLPDVVAKDKVVFTSTSETTRLSGIADELDKSGHYQSLRKRLSTMDRATQGDEMRRLGAAPDIVVGSVHAVTEDGRLVVASATGSQLGPYAASAGKAVWFVGSQKIVRDLDAAMRRIESYAYPLEDARARRVYGGPSKIGKLLIINGDAPHRSTVVLIREPIGF